MSRVWTATSSDADGCVGEEDPAMAGARRRPMTAAGYSPPERARTRVRRRRARSRSVPDRLPRDAQRDAGVLPQRLAAAMQAVDGRGRVPDEALVIEALRRRGGLLGQRMSGWQRDAERVVLDGVEQHVGRPRAGSPDEAQVQRAGRDQRAQFQVGSPAQCQANLLGVLPSSNYQD